MEIVKVLTDYPDCWESSAWLKAIMLDLCLNISKGQVRALCVILDSGIVAEIKNKVKIDVFDKRHWLAVLENDYCMSGKIVEESLDAWIKAVEVNRRATSIFRQTSNAQSAESGSAQQTTASQNSKKYNINGASTNAGQKNAPAEKHSESPLGYVYHNQLGYGKVEQKDGGWITVRFIDYAYKTERYRLSDVGTYLKFVTAEEYNKKTAGKKEWQPKKSSAEYYYPMQTDDILFMGTDDEDEWLQNFKDSHKTEIDDYDEDGAGYIDDQGDDARIYRDFIRERDKHDREDVEIIKPDFDEWSQAPEDFCEPEDDESDDTVDYGDDDWVDWR